MVSSLNVTVRYKLLYSVKCNLAMIWKLHVTTKSGCYFQSAVFLWHCSWLSALLHRTSMFQCGDTWNIVVVGFSLFMHIFLWSSCLCLSASPPSPITIKNFFIIMIACIKCTQIFSMINILYLQLTKSTVFLSIISLPRTALQWIHKCIENARNHNYYYLNEASHAWVEYYYRKISSDRFCINEW